MPALVLGLLVVLGLWLLVSLAIEAAALRAAWLARRPAPQAFTAPVMPPRSDEPVRLLVLGDLQGGVVNVLGGLADRVRARRPHVLLFCGDLVSHGEPPYYGLFFEAFRRAGIDVPARAVPGNHDLLPRRSKDERLGAPNFLRHLGPRRWVFDAGIWRIVGVDTGAFWPFARQHDFVLDALQDERPWVLLMHRPPFNFNLPDAPPYRDLVDLVTFLREHRPRVALCGHVKEAVDQVVDGVRYVVNPYGGDRRRGRGRDDRVEVVEVELRPDGKVETQSHALSRRSCWPLLLDAASVRLWASRRHTIGKLASLPARLPLRLLGLEVSTPVYPIQRRTPTREEAALRRAPLTPDGAPPRRSATDRFHSPT